MCTCGSSWSWDLGAWAVLTENSDASAGLALQAHSMGTWVLERWQAPSGGQGPRFWRKACLGDTLGLRMLLALQCSDSRPLMWGCREQSVHSQGLEHSPHGRAQLWHLGCAWGQQRLAVQTHSSTVTASCRRRSSISLPGVHSSYGC